jgi:hypothetical protein
MNILDFDAERHKDGVLPAVFKKTNQLFFDHYKEYQPSVKDIDVPIDIDTYEGQQAMKDFLQIRTVEELMEMREALMENHVEMHMHEEVGDSFNFLINSYILYGWDHNNFTPIEKLWDEFEENTYTPLDKEKFRRLIDEKIIDVVYNIHLACNKLKIRQWKKSQYLTDMLIFEERYEQVFYSFINLIFTLNIDPELLWSIFSRKNQCNEFRLNTGY